MAAQVPAPASTFAATTTLTGADGKLTLNVILVTPQTITGTDNKPNGTTLVEVGVPTLISITSEINGQATTIAEYVTFANAPTSIDGKLVTAGQPFSVGVPPSTTPVLSAAPTSNSSSLRTSSATRSSTASASTVLRTETDLYVYFATRSALTVAPYETYVFVGIPSTSTTTTVNDAGITTAQAILVTPSYQYRTGADNTLTPTASSMVSVGTPFPTHNSQKSNTGLSTGAGVGIGVGCIIAGALIAFAAAFFLLRRKPREHTRRRHRSQGPSGDYDGYAMSESKTPVVNAAMVEVPQDSTAAIVHNNLPQPKEDNSLMADFSRLKSRIDGHVQTFYLPSGGSEKPAIEAFSSVFGAQSPVPLNRLSALLADSRSRSQVLRAAIAWIITQRISPSGDPAESFLPAEIAGAYANLSNNRMDESTRSAFLSEWRVMTATLSHSLYDLDSLSANDHRLAKIQIALRQADMFLAPLASSADHDTRLRNLEEIMKRAARLGWTLFSQPSEFTTDWTDDGRGVVLFPGLLQVTDENGRVLRRARVFGQKEIVAL